MSVHLDLIAVLDVVAHHTGIQNTYPEGGGG